MYDHITFHLNEDYPDNLPEPYAAHHIGYYYAWAVSQNLHSESAAALPGFDELRSGAVSGAEFVLAQLGGGIDETCFNELGNRFTRFYYVDEEEGYGLFMEDYFTALGIENESGFYHIENSPEIQSRLNPVFQTGFERWKNSLK
ncbi:MAG: hypothetical protein Q4A84_09910 [Neisseria sp.]|uniref:DUF7832 domain-containing protein n=1 Tax=Neisseria sp. TaxID=192066 RepID=UPI0026DB2031|nr:hypothetical protein [Neisseria sp.]MDO4641994.1 hypothetical protein [Neisseria sp.]